MQLESITQHLRARFGQRQIDRDPIALQLLTLDGQDIPDKLVDVTALPFRGLPVEQCAQARNHPIRPMAVIGDALHDARTLVKSGGAFASHSNAASLFAIIAPNGWLNSCAIEADIAFMAVSRPSRSRRCT